MEKVVFKSDFEQCFEICKGLSFWNNLKSAYWEDMKNGFFEKLCDFNKN